MNKYKRYLNELNAELYERLKHNTVLVSGTGSGKTTLIMSHAKRKVAEGKTVIVVMPTRGLVENKAAKDNSTEVVYAYGKEAAQKLRGGAEIIVTVYDTLVYLLQRDIFGECTIYIDEAHKLLTDAGFRQETLEGLLTIRKEGRFEVILMTATPAALEDMGFDIVKVEKEGPKEIKPVYYFDTGNHRPETVAKQIIDRADETTLNIYRLQDKAAIDRCVEYSQSKGRVALAIYSDKEDGEANLDTINALAPEELAKLKKAIIDPKVTDLFGTSFIEEGLDFTAGKRKTVSHLLPENIVSSSKEIKGNYARAESVVQCPARVRDVKDAEIRVYGRFGTSDGDRTARKLQREAQEGDPEYIVEAAAKWTEDCHNYTPEATDNALRKYSHRVVQAGVYQIDTSRADKSKKDRPPYLLANVANGHETMLKRIEAIDIDEVLRYLGLEKGTEPLNRSQSNAARKLLISAENARIGGLDVELFYTDRGFEAKTMENLSQVVKCFSTAETDSCPALRFLFIEAYKRGKILKEEFKRLSPSEQQMLKTFCIQIAGTPKSQFSESSLKRQNIKINRFKDWRVKLDGVLGPLGIPDEDVNQTLELCL